MKKDDLKKQVDADSLAEEAAHHISRRAANYSPPIAGTYLLRLRQELRAGVRAGDRLTTLRTRVRQVLTGQTPDRVDKIVRTEVIGGLNKGSLSAYQRSPVVEKKTWLTARDGRVRPTKPGHFNHKAADGQTVAKLDPFSVGGESLQHPGDPSASAGNIIRCRCAMKPVISQVTPAAVQEPVDVPLEVPSEAPVQIDEKRYKGWIDENIRNSPRTDFLPSPRGKRGRQIKSFFKDLEKVDDELEKEGILRRIAQKFRIPDIINNVQEFGAEFRSDAFASFDPFISSVTGFAKNRMKFNFGQFLARTTSVWERAHGVIHEGFHALQWGRGWYSRTAGEGIKAGLMNASSKEAVRMKELWLKAVDRAKDQLRTFEAAGRRARIALVEEVELTPDRRLSFQTLIDEGEKARILRVRIGAAQEEFGVDFGNSYRSGLADIWEEIGDLSSWRSEASGMKKAYGLHSPHEFGSTNFELYVTAPTSLASRNKELFDFFDNFYKEGVFKRIVDYIREIGDAFQRQNH